MTPSLPATPSSTDAAAAAGAARSKAARHGGNANASPFDGLLQAASRRLREEK